MKISFSIVVIGVLFVGCSTHPVDPKIEMKPPVYVEQLPPKTKQQVVVNPGSIFGQGENPLFSDLKAMHPNDIVTVVISESTAQSSDGSKTISKNNSDSLGAGVLTGFGGTVGTAITNKAGKIGFNTSSTNSYKGSGTNSRKESFTTTISARIIKILSNGNYFIEGNRELLVNGEKQMIQISGVIRPYDIGPTNTINSKYVADAKIMYKTEGDINRATTQPWGSKFLQSLWPF